MTRARILFALLSAVAACGPAMPVTSPARHAMLSVTEARDIVADLEKKQAQQSANDKLLKPGSLDDVMEILRRDQVDLFQAGIDFAAKTPDDPKAMALQGQIELAWGEAQMIVAQVVGDSTAELRVELRPLETRAAAGGLDEKDTARLKKLRDIVRRNTDVADALQVLAAEHIAAGAKLAKKVIEKNPNDYHGYRVVADYYRLRGDWAKFDEMVAKIEATNPQSNGLVFLKGVSLLYRGNDRSGAAALFTKALEKDPKFTRAQVQLMLSQSSVEGIWGQYQKLQKLNPAHQIVTWAGETIQDAWSSSLARNDRMLDRATIREPSAK